ncbi:hypothetical protein LXL04_027315 [Taraxacum kok-saghyz]
MTKCGFNAKSGKSSNVYLDIFKDRSDCKNQNRKSISLNYKEEADTKRRCLPSAQYPHISIKFWLSIPRVVTFARSSASPCLLPDSFRRLIASIRLSFSTPFLNMFSDPRSEEEVEATTSIQEQRFVLGMPTSGGRMNERRPYEQAEVVRTIFGDFFFLDPRSGKSFACVDEETENGERRRV